MLQLVVVLICSTNASKFQAANKIFVVTRCQPRLASCRQFGIEKKPKVFALGFFYGQSLLFLDNAFGSDKPDHN
ncbi:hypothetical protein K151_3077 [Proteus hauseri ZMd44]|nr:hypothetical protein K151_3077 [Proteus hauseri ZMd44]